MTKSWKCLIGLHAWHVSQDQSMDSPDPHFLECARCRKLSSKPTNVAARIGWPGRPEA